MLRNNTPVEEYLVKDRLVYVKREDLSAEPPMPPLAKLRGAYELLKKLKSEGIKTVGVFDTNISRAGQGISYIAKEFGIKVILCHPMKKELSEQHKIAESLGAELFPIKPNVTPICYAVAKKEMELRGVYMIPFGVSCQESIIAVAKEASLVPDKLFSGSVVMSVGSATIISGILLHKPRTNIFGISAGANNKKQYNNILNLLLPHGIIPGNVILIPAIMPYTEADSFNCPFPSSPYYDRKAWHWLVDHINELNNPILFWNIGQL